MMLPAHEFPNDGGKTPHAPLGMAVNRWHHLVYVGLPTVNKIAVYSYDAQGSLHFVRAIADSGSVVCWLAVNKTGTRLYASNTADPSVTVYDLTENARDPREMQKLKIDSEGGAYNLR